MKHVVMFSGGAMSWACAKRVAEKHGTDNLVLLFTDTKMEDPTLYQFLDVAGSDVFGSSLRARIRRRWKSGRPERNPRGFYRIDEGRNPWEVFFDVKAMGGMGQMADPCSRILKRDLGDAWLDENCDRGDTTVYVGISWDEWHRFKGKKRNEKTGEYEDSGAFYRYERMGWRLQAPMCDAPYLSKQDVLAMAEQAGLPECALYEAGFTHNNCGGFCIKAGQAHFRKLASEFPERYAFHEDLEREFNRRRVMEGKKPVAILRDRSGDGVGKPLTLETLRKMDEKQVDLFDWGGCGCFVEDEP